MEDDINGALSFSDNEEEASQSFGDYLDEICPHYLMYGMTWDDFWFGSLDRYAYFWQKHQLEIEQKNHELWLQGLYIRQAIDSAFDSSRKCKYPDKPHRITEMTEAEQRIEDEKKLATMRERLNAYKDRFETRKKRGG